MSSRDCSTLSLYKRANLGLYNHPALQIALQSHLAKAPSILTKLSAHRKQTNDESKAVRTFCSSPSAPPYSSEQAVSDYWSSGSSQGWPINTKTCNAFDASPGIAAGALDFTAAWDELVVVFASAYSVGSDSVGNDLTAEIWWSGYNFRSFIKQVAARKLATHDRIFSRSSKQA